LWVFWFQKLELLMPYLVVAGAKTFYVHRRPLPIQPPSLVFVHGAGGSHRHWLYQVRDLLPAETYALDLPGHGRSNGPGRDSIAAYGDWVVAFLDAAGLERVVLVGHSMGGAIALDLAVRYPDRLAGLGLIATGARLRVAPAILQGIQQDAQAAVDLICDWAFGPEVSPEMLRLCRRQMGETSPEVLYGDYCACDAFDALDRLGQIASPTMVLCGTQDRLTPNKYAVYLRDRIRGAVLQLVEGAGHMVMIEKPQVVARALLEFWEAL
jgi:pimeloyl-ACP methyl ester carboxylesterase